MSLNFEEEGSNLKNKAAFDEWQRMLKDLPAAIMTEGMAISLKKGAVYLLGRLKPIVPRWDWPAYIRRKYPNRKHLADTGRVAKGRIEYFPSFLVKFGNTKARHYHLLEYGFKKKGGKGKVEPTLILNNATQNALPQVEEVVAAETKAREADIIREVKNPTDLYRNLVKDTI